MTKLVTTQFKAHVGNQLIESLNESSNTAYYVFASDHRPRTTNTIPTPIDNEREVTIDAYTNMQFGKRLTANDMRLMIRNIPWVSDSYFTMYDDSDTSLQSKNYYTVVDEDSFFHVYKCLDNNANTKSTAQPDFSHITGSNAELYQTSDGFRWKYMFTIASEDYDKFATSTYIPVFSNTAVESNAVSGAIDIIKIEDGGKNYNNYTAGTFSGSDVRISGNTLVYQVSNSSLFQANGYYTDCLVYLNSGTGAGQYKTVSDFFTNASGSYITVNNAFTIPPENGTTYEISPRVEIKGNSFQSVNAVARGLVNALSTNSIYRVEMLNRGKEYYYATASVLANTAVGVTKTADLRPIYAPVGGHGSNSATELGSQLICISTSFSNNEANTIPSVNSFEKIGLLKDPKFANVGFIYQDANGAFIDGEKVYKIKPVRVNANASINTTSALVTCETGDFNDQFTVGEQIYLKSSNNIAHMLTTVVSIANSSQLTIDNTGLFACTEVLMYHANSSASAYISNTANSTVIYTSNVEGIFETDDVFVGNSSGAKAVINTISRNDVVKTFDTFVQLHKYEGEVTSGTFVEDEFIYQGVSANDSTANAYLHSVDTSSTPAVFYTTSQNQNFVNAVAIEGNNSGATGVISNKYNPEIVIGSGKILSLENIDLINRANNKTETFKLLFNFGP